MPTKATNGPATGRNGETQSLRRVYLAAFLLLLAVAAKAQTPEPTKISDAYAKAALLAAKAIERDDTEHLQNETRAAVDAADVEAVSADEIKTTRLLRTIATFHGLNNGWRVVAGYDRDKLQEILRRETACFYPFEESLRARQAIFPAACEFKPMLGKK